MIYPSNLEEKLGFDQIRIWLTSLCYSPMGQGYVERMAFTDNLDLLKKLLGQTWEFLQIIRQEETFPSRYYLNLGGSLRKAEIENSFLEEEEWLKLRQSLQTAFEALRFLANKPDDLYPYLKALTAGIHLEKSLLQRIDMVIDESGKVKDSASTELQRIRKAIIQEQNTLRKRLDTILRQSQSAGYLPDDASPTVRNGRLVIPVLAEHKRHIKGLIHDESATGQTSFIEPAEIFDLNNSIREWQLEERREVYRILVQLTNDLRPQIPSLYRVYTFLGQIDFIRAKARLANEMRATLPRLHKGPLAKWAQARHPLLESSLKKQGKRIVPIDIELTNEQKIIIISGPNAGGKSVSLKTAGLLQYMLQMGLLIPVENHSEAGLFEGLFVDMGDDQSLENDLSTYSSHLAHMDQFVKLTGKKSLFLIDEFGTGTEPQFGGAIAEAILHQLVKNKAFGIVTTHYSNLKTFADYYAEVANGAMRYDAKNLSPTYELVMGQPGSSFALEIAKKTGLPKHVIDKAKEILGHEQVKLDELIRDLEASKQENLNQALVNRKKNQELDKLLANNLKLQTLLENQKRGLLNEARAEARGIIQQANKQIEKAVKDIRESQAQKEKVLEVRQSIETIKQELKPVEPLQLPNEIFAEMEAQPVLAKEKEKPIIKEIGGAIQVGDYVRLKDSQTIGEVVSLKGSTAEITMGPLRTFLKIEKLQRVSGPGSTLAELEKPKAMKGINVAERMAAFSPSLDMRGMRAEEALAVISDFLDEAMLLGVKELRILHGKGDGVLRQVVRNHLSKNNQVASARDEHADRGGAGVTLVTMG